MEQKLLLAHDCTPACHTLLCAPPSEYRRRPQSQLPENKQVLLVDSLLLICVLLCGASKHGNPTESQPSRGLLLQARVIVNRTQHRGTAFDWHRRMNRYRRRRKSHQLCSRMFPLMGHHALTPKKLPQPFSLNGTTTDAYCLPLEK